MGKTPALPFRLTGPKPTHVIEVALALVHERVLLWPGLIVGGTANKVRVGAAMFGPPGTDGEGKTAPGPA